MGLGVVSLVSALCLGAVLTQPLFMRTRPHAPASTVAAPGSHSRVEEIRTVLGEQADWSINKCIEMGKECDFLKDLGTSSGSPFNLMTRFFCGHAAECQGMNDVGVCYSHQASFVIPSLLASPCDSQLMPLRFLLACLYCQLVLPASCDLILSHSRAGHPCHGKVQPEEQVCVCGRDRAF